MGAALAYGVSTLFVRAGSVHADGYVATLFMGGPAWIGSLLWTLGGRRQRTQMVPGNPAFLGYPLLATVAASGVAIYAVGNPLYIRSMQLAGVVLTTPAVQMQVLWAALLAAVLLAETVSRSAVLGISMFLAGMAALAWGQAGLPALTGGWLGGVLLGVAAGFCWSLGNVLMRKGLDRGQSVPGALAVANTAGFGLLLVFLAATGRWADVAALPPGTLLALVGSGLTNAAAQYCLVSALANTTVASVAVITATYVGAVAVAGHLLFGDALNVVMAAGVVLVMASVPLVQTRPTPPTAVAG